MFCFDVTFPIACNLWIEKQNLPITGVLVVGPTQTTLYFRAAFDGIQVKVWVPTWKVRNTEPLTGVAQLESLVKLDGGETGLLPARFIQTPEVPSWPSMTYLTVAV